MNEWDNKTFFTYFFLLFFFSDSFFLFILLKKNILFFILQNIVMLAAATSSYCYRWWGPYNHSLFNVRAVWRDTYSFSFFLRENFFPIRFRACLYWVDLMEKKSVKIFDIFLNFFRICSEILKWKEKSWTRSEWLLKNSFFFGEINNKNWRVPFLQN